MNEYPRAISFTILIFYVRAKRATNVFIGCRAAITKILIMKIGAVDFRTRAVRERKKKKLLTIRTVYARN